MPSTKIITGESASESSSSQHGQKKRKSGSSHSAAPATKRMRVSRACDQCRAGREKCDGIRPTCHSCDVQNRPCTYNEQPKKRGIQPNYIRTLELTLAWIFQSFPEAEARLSQLLPDRDGDVHQLVSYRNATKAEALHQLWRNGIVSRQIDQLLSGASIELPDASHPNVSIAANIEDAVAEPAEAAFPPDELESLPMMALYKPAGADDSLLPATETSDFTTTGPEMLKLPENAWSLLEHYFAFTQSWLPITEQHDVLKLMYAYPAEGLSMEEISSGDHAELWSLLALSAIQKFGAFTTPDLMRTAKALMPRQDGKFQLGHVKALLIQCLEELRKELWLAAWLTAGSAVRILTYLSSNMGQPKLLQIGRARHTFLAVFVIESAISLHIGAPTHLKSSIIQEVGLPIEDGLEEWSPWTNPAGKITSAAKAPIMAISTFNKLAKMAELFHDRQFSAINPAYNRSLPTNIIIQLIRNACDPEHHKQPSMLVADRIPRSLFDKSTPKRNGGLQPDMTPSPSNIQLWNNQAYPTTTQQDHTPFVSIPNASTDSAVGSTPAQADPKTDSPGVLSVGNPLSEISHPQPFTFENGDFFDTNIFEELASLERTDESDRPQFMQNLGFGPDLDLAEFFGADYQLSDPMLAHIQS